MNGSSRTSHRSHSVVGGEATGCSGCSFLKSNTVSNPG